MLLEAELKQLSMLPSLVTRTRLLYKVLQESWLSARRVCVYLMCLIWHVARSIHVLLESDTVFRLEIND